MDLKNPALMLDRELSWLAFNERVLEEAEDETTPLLERLKFLGIAASNLDEFFMVRISGVQEQIHADVKTLTPEGLTLQQHFERLHASALKQVRRQYECYTKKVCPALEKEKICVRRVADLRGPQREFVRELFDREVFPVLTPLAVDSGHPFPHLRNLSLNLAVRLVPPKAGKTNQLLFALVQVPMVIDRIIRLPAKSEDIYEFILLEDLISEEIRLLFPGLKVREVAAFRVTRDADIEFAEEEADDLLKSIEQELRARERGSAVRLGVESKASPELVKFLTETLQLNAYQAYPLDGPINLAEVSQIANMVPRDDLKNIPYTPSTREPLRIEKSIFRAVARRDVLLHHPFESFTPVVEFIEQAAKDPNVLAIKATLYRTSGDSAIIQALMEAAERGKQVAALMELKARFDEERNITWARKMEKAGVHVVYGLVGLKTHAKLCLVVRKEEGGIRRYVHISTGNYNPITARIYTDLCLLTCDPDLCDDASELFNMLTGYSRMPEWRKIIVAPLNLRASMYALIGEEIAKAKSGKPGRIRAKMNSLVDAEMIEKLYEASCAGVHIDMLIRGICCLRPGLKGVSENIRVYSIVDRFLEHSRIFIFGEGSEEKVYLSSADWMTRNLDRRVEIVFPIEAPALKQRIVEEIYSLSMRDNVKRRMLLSDGNYVRVPRGEKEVAVRAQTALIALEMGLREEERGREGAPTLIARPGPVVQPSELPIRPAQPAARTLNIASKPQGSLPALIMPNSSLPQNGGTHRPFERPVTMKSAPPLPKPAVRKKGGKKKSSR